VAGSLPRLDQNLAQAHAGCKVSPAACLFARGDGVGRFCYQVLHARSEPCGRCAVKAVLETRQPAWSPRNEDLLSGESVPCHYAYPIFAGDAVDVLHRDGTRIPINLNAAIVYEGNREVATIGFFHDMR